MTHQIWLWTFKPLWAISGMPPKVRQQYMPRAVSGRHCSGQVINLGPGQAQLYQACEIAEHGAAHHIDDKRGLRATIPVDAMDRYIQ
jgi:hypothetical protein